MSSSNKYRRLKVKFTSPDRREVQCRKTKVSLRTTPDMLKDSIKYHMDRARDLENILEVIEELQAEENRPALGEILLNAANEDRQPMDWFRATLREPGFYDSVAERFVTKLQAEKHLTAQLDIDHDEQRSSLERRKQAASRIIARRQLR